MHEIVTRIKSRLPSTKEDNPFFVEGDFFLIRPQLFYLIQAKYFFFVGKPTKLFFRPIDDDPEEKKCQIFNIIQITKKQMFWSVVLNACSAFTKKY